MFVLALSNTWMVRDPAVEIDRVDKGGVEQGGGGVQEQRSRGEEPWSRRPVQRGAASTQIDRERSGRGREAARSHPPPRILCPAAVPTARLKVPEVSRTPPLSTRLPSVARPPRWAVTRKLPPEHGGCAGVVVAVVAENPESGVGFGDGQCPAPTIVEVEGDSVVPEESPRRVKVFAPTAPSKTREPVLLNTSAALLATGVPMTLSP